MTGVWVVLGVLLAGVLVGFALRAREGRIRPASGERPRELPSAVTEVLTPAITLVQISTTFCAPCRHARARLAPLADRTEGLHHVELDVTHRPEVAQQLGVLRTPTTLAYTADGIEVLRVGGVPDGPELLERLVPHLPASRA